MAPRRSVIAAATFVAIFIILILHQFSAYSSYYHDLFTRGRPLTAWLNEEEERYTAFLQDRKELITKWGPSEAEVQP